MQQPKRQIRFKYSENKEPLAKILKRSRILFEAALEKRLERAGYAGEFGIILCGMAIGRGEDTHGLRIRTPCRDFRAVDITWHQGSNDSCLSIRVGAPHGVDSRAFYVALEEADRLIVEEMAEARRLARLRPKKEADVIKHPSVDIAEGSKDAMDSAILRILQISPDFGYFNREDDLEKLAEFGDPEQLLRSLVAGKHLLPISENLLQLAPEWLLKAGDVAGEAAPAAAPAPSAAQPEPAAPAAGNLLGQLKQAKLVAAQAEAARASLKDIEAQVGALEAQIKADTLRLQRLRARQEEASAVLQNPEIAPAEELLALVGELGKK